MTITLTLLIVIGIVSLILAFLSYSVGTWAITRLLRTDKKIALPKQLPPRSINTAETVGSAGTVDVAYVRPTQVCRGCGISAWLHTSEEEFQRCDRRANVMTTRGQA